MERIECGRKLDINYENGMILRADMLNRQAVEAESRWKYLYSGISGGIVAGFSLKKEEDGTHTFSEGLVKIDGELYLLDRVTEDMIYRVRDTDGEETVNDRLYHLCICADGETEATGELSPVTERKLYLKAIAVNEKKTKNTVIVASYQKMAGKIYFAETLNEHKGSMLSTFCGEYLIGGEKAVSPDITQLIRHCLEKKEQKDYLDMLLYMECLRGENLSQAAVLFYCSSKTGESVDWENVIEKLTNSLSITLSAGQILYSEPKTVPQVRNNNFDPKL